MNTKNVILYGPPGTGKTYQSRHLAASLCGGEPFEDLVAAGRIAWVTFHASYGYENFIEGISPALDDSDGDVRYQCVPGALKKLALQAVYEGLLPTDGPTFEVLWEHLLLSISAHQDTVIRSLAGHSFLLACKRARLVAQPIEMHGDDLVQVGQEMAVPSAYLATLWRRRDELLGDNPKRIRDLISEEHGHTACNQAVLWPLFKRLRALAQSPALPALPAEAKQRVAQAALEQGATFNFEDAPEFVLVVDEINRGDTSRILGEVMSALEEDKRIGAPSEVRIRLAYSQETFALPPNLHIIGTMNTADRSIAMMDAALRRRFHFRAVQPSSDVLRQHMDAAADLVSLTVQIFEVLNARIEVLLGREQVLGHSYFLEVDSHTGLAQVLTRQVLPLLDEAFHGDRTHVAMVLGCPVDEYGLPLRQVEQPFLRFKHTQTEQLFGCALEGVQLGLSSSINPALRTDTEALHAVLRGIL